MVLILLGNSDLPPPLEHLLSSMTEAKEKRGLTGKKPLKNHQFVVWGSCIIKLIHALKFCSENSLGEYTFITCQVL